MTKQQFLISRAMKLPTITIELWTNLCRTLYKINNNDKLNHELNLYNYYYELKTFSTCKLIKKMSFFFTTLSISLVM